MKINKIENNNLNQPISKKQSNHKPITQELIQKDTNKTPNNPKYYQALNNISFKGEIGYLAMKTKDGIKLHIPYSKQEKLTLEFNQQEASIFLKEGQIDNELIAYFVEIFNGLYLEKKRKHDKDIAFLNKVIEEKEEPTLYVIDPIDDSLKAFLQIDFEQDEDALKTFLYNTHDIKTRKLLAQNYLEDFETIIAKTPITTAQEALLVMQLSKTKDGFDNSNMNQKLKLAVLLGQENLSKNINLVPEFLKCITKEDGTYDLDLAEKVLLLSSSCQYEEDFSPELIKKCTNIAKKISQFDEKDYSEAIRMLDAFHFSDKLNVFKYEKELDCFLNCFNPVTKRCDCEAKSLLLVALNDANEIIEESKSSLRTEQLREVAISAVDDYFKAIKDKKTGKIKENYPSPYNFLKYSLSPFCK